MNLQMIVAMDQMRAIAKNGKIPWRLKADMEHFVNMTKEKIVVMGRKTWDSLPEKFKPLPNRENVILTSNKDLVLPGCKVLHSRNEVLHLAQFREVWIMGGAEIYKMFLPYTNRLIVTHVETVVDGDVFFPPIGREWKTTLLFHQETDEKNHYPFQVVEYKR